VEACVGNNVGKIKLNAKRLRVKCRELIKKNKNLPT
jgi:hypothetical protein